MRRFVLQLPNVSSYCDCQKLCSPAEVEHAYPRSLLKKKLSKKVFLEANKDLHNLHKCCRNVNRLKADSLLGKTYFREFSGIIARSCLYMDETYSLKTSPDLIKKWYNLSLIYPPSETELERAEKIEERTGKSNYYIEQHRYN